MGLFAHSMLTNICVYSLASTINANGTLIMEVTIRWPTNCSVELHHTLE